jgi:hypothetical protein
VPRRVKGHSQARGPPVVAVAVGQPWRATPATDHLPCLGCAWPSALVVFSPCACVLCAVLCATCLLLPEPPPPVLRAVTVVSLPALLLLLLLRRRRCVRARQRAKGKSQRTRATRIIATQPHSTGRNTTQAQQATRSEHGQHTLFSSPSSLPVPCSFSPCPPQSAGAQSFLRIQPPNLPTGNGEGIRTLRDARGALIACELECGQSLPLNPSLPTAPEARTAAPRWACAVGGFGDMEGAMAARYLLTMRLCPLLSVAWLLFSFLLRHG